MCLRGAITASLRFRRVRRMLKLIANLNLFASSMSPNKYCNISQTDLTITTPLSALNSFNWL